MAEDSSDSDEEEDKESLDDKLKRITKLGQEGDVQQLVQEANLAECPPEMIAFASRRSKDMGNLAFQKKEYKEALEFYAAALVGNCPEKHKIYSNRSACLFQLGKYTESLVEATKAIKEDRSWSKGYFRAGRAALEMEYIDEALDMFEKGLEQEPSNQDLATWAKKARDIRNQTKKDLLVKKHSTDYSKFSAVVKQQAEEDEEEEMANDPNRIILGDKYYTSSKMEQRQLKAMLGYKEDPPPPFEPNFSPDVIYRHDARGAKTQHPVWDPTAREWRIDAKPAPSRVDYSDSTQTQAIALFLERQSDVQYAEELLNLLDQKASPIDAYVKAMRSIVGQLMNSGNVADAANTKKSDAGYPKANSEDAPSSGSQRSKQRRGIVPDDARWLFVGAGSGLPMMTVARYLPTAELIAVSAHRASYIADLSLAVFASNGLRKEQFKFIHRPSHELAIVDPNGEDINNLTKRVDVVVFDYELFDPGLLGKGILTKINHAKKKLLASEHLTVPMGASVSCAPCETLCPRAGEAPDGLEWRAMDECRWGAFYETANLDASGLKEPWRPLGPVLEVFDFDFTERELKMTGQADLRFVATEDGVLNCIVFWYRMSLAEGVELDHTPEALRGGGSTQSSGDYYKHAIQWLPAPIKLSKGDEVVVRAAYSRSRIRFELISPEVKVKERQLACPRWMYLRLWDEERLEAFRKAIDKAVDRIIAERENVSKLDRQPLRLVHLGAGMGQISMLAAKCLRDAGVSEADIETHGYTVVAFEQMPKMKKLAQRLFRDNQVDRDIFFSSEDIRRLPNQPQRAQLIISELFDPGLLGEGILPLLSAARVKTCSAFDHQVIPSRATVWAAAFEFGEHLHSCHGFDLSAFNHYRTGLMVDVDGAVEKGYAKQLSAAFEALKFDFESNEMPAMRPVQILPTDSGKITAIVFWYELHLDREGDIILTNWPESIPPADFTMMEKDLHRVAPLRQAVCNFQGEYVKEVTKAEPIEINVGYTQSWPQFVWPGTEMVQKESGEMIPKPPPMPRHRMYFEKMRHETQELEQKLQSGLMFDEEMLGDGFAAAERIALEPNGNPNYLIDPNNANFFHLMFFI